MQNININEVLYSKFILPFYTKRDFRIGVELELPILNLKDYKVDHCIVRNILKSFIKQGFVPIQKDMNNHIIAIMDSVTKDVISFEYSYNTIELSLAAEADIHMLHSRFKQYIYQIKHELKPYGYCVSGFGLNPFYSYIEKECIRDERYQMIEKFLQLVPDRSKIHRYPYFCSMISSVQTHLDIQVNKICKFLEVTDKLMCIKYLLFSNSLFLEENGNIFYKYRDYLWEHSMFGYNPINVGNYNVTMENEQDLLQYCMNMSIFSVIREGKHLFFTPIALKEFMEKKKIIAYHWNSELGKCDKVLVEPQILDVKGVRTYKNCELTPRGTIEIRNDCQQPLGEVFSVVAFNLGVYLKLEQIELILDEMHRKINFIYLKYGNSKVMEAFIDCNNSQLQYYMDMILQTVEEALISRGKGEEIFISCLYNRVRTLQSPAMRMKTLYASTKEEEIIKLYGEV